jgi:hypothetical protein
MHLVDGLLHAGYARARQRELGHDAHRPLDVRTCVFSLAVRAQRLWRRSRCPGLPFNFDVYDRSELPPVGAAAARRELQCYARHRRRARALSRLAHVAAPHPHRVPRRRRHPDRGAGQRLHPPRGVGLLDRRHVHVHARRRARARDRLCRDHREHDDRARGARRCERPHLRDRRRALARRERQR